VKKILDLFLAIIGGLLLWSAWSGPSLTFLVFIAWIPMLLIEDQTSNWKKLFGLTYLHMLIWNVLTTWWIANSTLPGALGAFFANSLIMCIPWLLFHFTKKRFGKWVGYTSLVIFWLSFEYIHYNWELSWPWLTLGNAFAWNTGWVQWYEYTGTSGGSFWILLSNVILYAAFLEYRSYGRSVKYFAIAAGWLLLMIFPNIISHSILNNSKKEVDVSERSASKNIVIVQPDIDPWDEKFEAGKQEAQLQKLVTLSENKVDSNTALVVWPETAIPFECDETKLDSNYFLNSVWHFLKIHPHINLVTGLEGVRLFKFPNSIYSRPVPQEPGTFYESYNSAVIFDSSHYSIYHKSKLVPGVETLPSFLKFMDKIFEKFGGTAGGYARNNGAKILLAGNSGFKIAPAICYESIYGDYMTEFMRKGANIICVMTNDGWWGDTPGYKQHMNYARLRAIETRKWVVRSANTGISCFIDPTGNVIDPQPWNTATSIKMDVPANETMTFYSKHGDILSRIMLVLGGLLILLDLTSWSLEKFFKIKFPARNKI
jgi:apolipoprotein N-acyltransferase